MIKGLIMDNIFRILDIRRHTALYIGEESVEFAVFKWTLKGPKLVKSGKTYIYPEGAKDIEDEARDEYILEAMKRLFKENDINPLRLVLGLPSREVMVRYFQMPRMPRKEWRSAINFEATRYIPFRMEDVVSDFKVFGSSSNTMDVVFVVVRQNVIERFVKLVEKSGVKSVIVEPSSFSLIRAFIASGQMDPNVNTSIIDIDPTTLTINIIRKKMPCLVRDISLNAPGEPVLDKIISEVKLSFDFYKKQFPSEPIDKIIINTHMKLENLREVAEKELGIPIEIGDPLRGMKIEEGITAPTEAVCCGLGLRGLSKSFLDINLSVEDMLVYYQKRKFLKVLYVEAATAILLLIILKVVCISTLNPLRNELNLIVSKTPKVEASMKNYDIDRLENIKNGMKKKIYTLGNLISHRTYITAKLDSLPDLLPQNVWLRGLDFKERVDEKDVSKIIRELTIDGYCAIDEDTRPKNVINDFLRVLERSLAVNSGMSVAKVVSIERDKFEGEEVSSFKILFQGP